MSSATLDVHARTLREAVARLKVREAELRCSRAEVVRTLARAVEYRDRGTGEHIERMGRYAQLLAERLGVDHVRCELIGLASQLHDVGKIAIPDSIIDKQGELTPVERALVETHAELGHRLLAGSVEPVLRLAAQIAWTHHERCDGSGYPRGLRRTEIPFEGRIAAVADVFDALTSDRPYRPRLPLAEVLVYLRSERGAGFDPEVVDALLANLDDLIEVGGLAYREKVPA